MLQSTIKQAGHALFHSIPYGWRHHLATMHTYIALERTDRAKRITDGQCFFFLDRVFNPFFIKRKVTKCYKVINDRGEKPTSRTRDLSNGSWAPHRRTVLLRQKAEHLYILVLCMREGTEYAAAAEIGKAEDNPIIIDMIWCFGIDMKNDLPDVRNVDQDQPTMSARFLLLLYYKRFHDHMFSSL